MDSAIYTLIDPDRRKGTRTKQLRNTVAIDEEDWKKHQEETSAIDQTSEGRKDYDLHRNGVIYGYGG